MSWLKEGDRNTKFFHQKATWRARRNRIKKLKKMDGEWSSFHEEMAGMVNDFFFQNLYTKDPSVQPQEVADLFVRQITDDMNLELCKPFSEKEIGDALFQIGIIKAPGPDGFPARFFQQNCGVPKDDVVARSSGKNFLFLQGVACRRESTTWLLCSSRSGPPRAVNRIQTD